MNYNKLRFKSAVSNAQVCNCNFSEIELCYLGFESNVLEGTGFESLPGRSSLLISFKFQFHERFVVQRIGFEYQDNINPKKLKFWYLVGFEPGTN